MVTAVRTAAGGARALTVPSVHAAATLPPGAVLGTAITEAMLAPPPSTPAAVHDFGRRRRPAA